MPKLNQQFQLPDGRRLGYDEYGSPDAKPLFYFHGSPSARVEFALFGDEELLRSLAPKIMVANAASFLPEPDRTVISDPEMQKGFIAMLREALRQGTRGAFHESLLTVSDWGFRLQEIQMPILLWHGEADQSVPAAMARYAASAIPQCEAKFYADEGHLSVFKKYAEEIIRSLVD